MARKSLITMAALNVAMHEPHSSSEYASLMRAAFNRQAVIRFGALHVLMLGTLGRARQLGGSQVLSGDIYRFVKLDPTEPWFNAETREPATEAEVSRIQIPSNLLPHLQSIPFVFNLDTHLFWFIAKHKKDSLGAHTAERFLAQLLEPTASANQMPPVSVTALPESSSVERILKLPGLEILRIEMTRPNPDSTSSAEARWHQRMQDQGAAKLKIEMYHARNTELEPDAETKEAARVAARNGKVYGRGRSAGGLTIEDSTQDRPLLKHDTVDSDIETPTHVLERAALHNGADT